MNYIVEFQRNYCNRCKNKVEGTFVIRDFFTIVLAAKYQSELININNETIVFV
jgi:hypothetical protein